MIGLAARLRRALYDRGILEAERLPRPVVSIGNLSVGGSGKTPHVRFIADWLVREGLRVAILSRGYGRSTRGVVWVSDGERLLASWSESGDEPYLLASSLRNVPVLVAESRAAAGRACLSKTEVDLFLLDDGMQHLPLHRDLDILLVDAARGLGNRLTLPFGMLREPPSHAKYADAVVVTKCRDIGQGREVARTIPNVSGKTVAYSAIRSRSIVDREGNARPIDPAGTPVAAFSALARNDQFVRTLTGAGYVVRSFTGFRDHHRFSAADLRKIAASAGGLPLLTTEKDLVRLPSTPPFAVEALSVEVEWLAGWDALSSKIMATIGNHAK
jgi:tetraacyldisaccharide 4'-kinase